MYIGMAKWSLETPVKLFMASAEIRRFTQAISTVHGGMAVAWKEQPDSSIGAIRERSNALLDDDIRRCTREQWTEKPKRARNSELLGVGFCPPHSLVVRPRCESVSGFCFGPHQQERVLLSMLSFLFRLRPWEWLTETPTTGTCWPSLAPIRHYYCGLGALWPFHSHVQLIETSCGVWSIWESIGKMQIQMRLQLRLASY